MEEPTVEGPGQGAELRPDGPGIWFPPPLVYLLLLGGAYGLDRQRGSLELWPGGGWASPLSAFGLLLVLAGLGLDLWSLDRFRRARTSALPFRPAARFVAVGPYRFTRNPMYLGMTLWSAGLALMLDSARMLAAAAAAALVLNLLVIPREERYLARRFGDGYLDYRRRVRRWL